MKSKNKLLHETFIKYLIKLLIVMILIPLFIFILLTIISMLDFEWIYKSSPDLYYFLRRFFNYFKEIFSNNIENSLNHLVFDIIWLITIIILSYHLMKKVFSYIYVLEDATNQLFDKNIDYIELPPELESISNKMNHLKYESEKNERLAREAEQRKNDLIVYLAHDLKTPLTSVIGYLELLKDAPTLPIEQRIKYTNITLDKAYRLEELMNEFFEIARFNDTNIVLMKQNLNLKLLFEQIIDEFYPMTNEQNKSIIINCDESITCFADSDKLSRVFNNVIKNAISYSFENTNINIDVFLKGETITVLIQNEGYTIPENKLNSIFERFYRLDNARNSINGGAGLGLAIAREIITLHGGTIQAESKDNKTTFTLTIPKS